MRGSYSERVPRRECTGNVHHIVEEEVDGQEEGQDDKREDGEQGEESGENNQTQRSHEKLDRMSADPNMSQCMCV